MSQFDLPSHITGGPCCEEFCYPEFAYQILEHYRQYHLFYVNLGFDQYSAYRRMVYETADPLNITMPCRRRPRY